MDKKVKKASAIIGVITTLFLALWNGLVIRWKHTGLGSELWHASGAIIRMLVLVPIILGFWGEWILMSIFVISYFIAAFPLYNLIINLIRGEKWDHLGNSFVDGFFKKNKTLYWILQVTLIMALIILVICHVKIL